MIQMMDVAGNGSGRLPSAGRSGRRGVVLNRAGDNYSCIGRSDLGHSDEWLHHRAALDFVVIPADYVLFGPEIGVGEHCEQ